MGYKNMVDSLRGVATGDSINDWDINWSLFREINGLENSSNPIPYKEVANLHPTIRRIINKFVGKAPMYILKENIGGGKK